MAAIACVLNDWFATLDTFHRGILCAAAYLAVMCPISFLPDFDQTNREDEVE